MKLTVKQRFYAKVALPDENGCMLWLGAKNSTGRGVFGNGQRLVLAHRFSFELHAGPIPEGMNVNHHCDNGLCCAPEHLYAGSQAENVTDMDIRGRRAVGSKHPRAVLSEEKVRSARKRIKTGEASLQSLMNEYGVSYTAISYAVVGRTWRHVS